MTAVFNTANIRPLRADKLCKLRLRQAFFKPRLCELRNDFLPLADDTVVRHIHHLYMIMLSYMITLVKRIVRLI